MKPGKIFHASIFFFLSFFFILNNAFAVTPFAATLPDNFVGVAPAERADGTIVIGGKLGSAPAVVTIRQNADGSLSMSTQIFPGLPGGNGTGIINDVTSDGLTFAGSSVSGTSLQGAQTGEATVWSSRGIPTGLGYDPTATHLSEINSISENGIGAGNNGNVPAALSVDNVIILSNPEGGAAGGISANGSIITGGLTYTGPVFWKSTSPGSMQYQRNSVSVPTDCIPDGSVVTVSPDGSMLGGLVVSMTYLENIGVIWDSNGQVLHTFGPGMVKSIANGGIAAFNSTENGVTRANIFRPGYGVVPLVGFFKQQRVVLSGIDSYDTIFRLKNGTRNGVLIVGRATTIGAYQIGFVGYVNVSPAGPVVPARIGSRPKGTK